MQIILNLWVLKHMIDLHILDPIFNQKYIGKFTFKRSPEIFILGKGDLAGRQNFALVLRAFSKIRG